MVISSDACLIFGAMAGIVAVYVTPCVTCDDVLDEETKKTKNRNLNPKIVVHNTDGNTISHVMNDKIHGERTFESLKMKVISLWKSDFWKLIIRNENSRETSSGASYHSANEHFTNRTRTDMSPTEINTQTLSDSDDTTYLPLDVQIQHSKERRNEQEILNNIVDDNNNIKRKGSVKRSENEIELIDSLRQSTFIETQNKASRMAEIRNTLRQLENFGEFATADENTQETAHDNKLVIVFKRSVKPLRRIFQNIHTKSRSKRKTRQK